MNAHRLHLPVHTSQTAPAASRDLLESTQAKLGFVPNLFGMLANAPALLEGYLTLSGIFDTTSLSATERQVVLLAVSFENGCDYCMAAHTAIARMQKVDPGVLAALREGLPIGDGRLQALRGFTAEVARSRGWPTQEAVSRFVSAGYTPVQALEVVLGVGVKTLSNYANHLAGTPLDAAFAPAQWSKPALQATGCCSTS
jgi:uncharacterized peroxidase-related enzyme